MNLLPPPPPARPENLASLRREPFGRHHRRADGAAGRAEPEVRFPHGNAFQFHDDDGTRVGDAAPSSRKCGAGKQLVDGQHGRLDCGVRRTIPYSTAMALSRDDRTRPRSTRSPSVAGLSAARATPAREPTRRPPRAPPSWHALTSRDELTAASASSRSRTRRDTLDLLSRDLAATRTHEARLVARSRREARRHGRRAARPRPARWPGRPARAAAPCPRARRRRGRARRAAATPTGTPTVSESAMRVQYLRRVLGRGDANSAFGSAPRRAARREAPAIASARRRGR